ncbi:MAG TPA: MFS transporter [Anaerolineae bacterium]|nr:MFS transporter [Anaerolineae bacterium]HOQ97944.1 MFS transporter [Anaerolineae bacterium]HPL27688.1 MFS transporter [Anaerolineae bacterium]
MNQSLPAVAKPARAALALTAAYYLAFVALGLSAAVTGPTLPGLVAQTGASLGEIGVLFTTRSLGYMLGSLGGGRLYDRRHGHPIIAAALVAMAALLAAVPLAPRLWLLAALLLALGLSEGTIDVGANTLLVWVHRGRVGPFMNGLHLFFGVGTFISPVIVAQAALHTGGIAWAYWALALAALPAALWLLRLPSPADGASAEPGAVSGRASALLVVLVAAFFFLYVGAEVGFGGWIYTYALAMGVSDPTIAAYLVSAFWGSFTVGRLAGIPLSARFSPRAILAADLAGCIASVAILLAFPHAMAALWLGTLGVGAAMASIYAVTLSLAERHLAFTGRVAGWFFVGAGGGGMVLPWLIGRLFGTLGPRAGLAAILADLLVAAAVFVLLIAYTKRRPAPETEEPAR